MKKILILCALISGCGLLALTEKKSEKAVELDTKMVEANATEGSCSDKYESCLNNCAGYEPCRTNCEGAKHCCQSGMSDCSF